MAKQAYITKRFSRKSKILIEQAIAVMDEYRKAGYTLTLRQLYYQLVARGLIPNTLNSYKRLGSAVGDARLAGLMDWAMIEDRERPVYGRNHYDDPRDFLISQVSRFAINRWEGQPSYIEVMVEKKALQGVVYPVCIRWDVLFTANRGYSSLTALHQAGRRLIQASAEGKELVVFYLGDHDPSGLDMDRDIQERLELFTGAPVQVLRLALTREQIEQYNPPPNPAKLTDSRAEEYIYKHGRSSWELDALEPQVLEEVIEERIKELIYWEAWDRIEDLEDAMKGELLDIARGAPRRGELESTQEEG